jgi:hypothetical protein
MSTAIGTRDAPAQLVDAREHRIRHIHPTEAYLGGRPSEGATQTILGRTYGFTELPLSHLPTSHDLVEGTYTRRLGDAGEFSLTFPNAAGSKGLWRERFSVDRSMQFIEIYRADVLEFVGVIQRVEIDRGRVEISGPDASALLRRTYESDRTWTAAPRDVVEAYTRVPTWALVDTAWTIQAGNGYTDADPEEGGSGDIDRRLAVIECNYGASQFQGVMWRPIDVGSDDWRITAVLVSTERFSSTVPVRADLQAHNSASGKNVSVGVSGDAAGVSSSRGVAQLGDWDAPPNLAGSTAGVISVALPEADGPVTKAPITLVLERQGRWIRGFAQGRLIGQFEVTNAGATAPDRLRIRVTYNGLPPPPTSGIHRATFKRITVERRRPFLARGAEKGDYVLPGDYPTGGLRGRYYNNADLQGLSSAGRKARIMAPSRESYGERIDPSVAFGAGITPIQPGASTDFFSVRWFGAVYLRQDLGNYQFRLTNVDDGARLWVAKTGWGEQLLDGWVEGAGTIGPATLSGIGAEAGWYPLVLEYFESGGAQSIAMQFLPPASYTDAGGGAITGSTWQNVPGTSLSPLGCYDNRVQGQSHFDLAYGAAREFGYQLTCEPMQLESGEFPGRLVPRVRVGRDTDVVLEVDDTDRAEPILTPGVTIDSEDQAVVLRGSAAGLPDGQGSQVTAEIADIPALRDALFALEARVDAPEISFPQLLAARLNGELALRATPWEEVRGVPRAQERLADTWPLSQALSAMRWRPGDGLRISVPSIGVEDESPRQLLQVTRSFGAEGRTATQVAFRQRPRSAASTVRRLLRAATMPHRAYQRQKVTLSSNWIGHGAADVGAGGFTDFAILGVNVGDQIVKAIARISMNTTAQPLGIEINFTDRTSALGGSWSVVPVDIDITGYAGAASAGDNRFYIRLRNNGGGTTLVQFQLIVEVLR